MRHQSPAPSAKKAPAKPPAPRVDARAKVTAPKTGGTAGYDAQKATLKPKPTAGERQGATLQNNHALKEQGKPQPQHGKQHGQEPPGQFLVAGQAFATLGEVHDWLTTAKPQDPEIVIKVTPGGQVQATAQTLWNYYNPKQKIVLDGQGGTVTGVHGGHPTVGYFLSYRPAVGTGTTSVDRPAAANLEVKNLSIRGFESGGIEISPQQVAGKANEWDGGINAFVGGASIHDVNFSDLGNAHTARKERVWNDLRFGAAGVMMRGVQNSVVEDCNFQGLTNGEMTFHNTDDKGRQTTQHGEGNHLFHAVYLRDQSSNNLVRNNQFNDVGGDPVRVSNASNNNVIAGNKAQNAGVHGLVSNWFNSAKGEKDSTGTKIRNNKIGHVHGKSTQGTAYNRKEAKGKQGSVTT